MMVNKLEILGRMTPLLSWLEPRWLLTKGRELLWKYALWTTRGVLDLC
jgi:hypothetical protein